MIFSSNEFLLVFLPVALIGYQVLGRFGRVAMFSWLSLVSLFFYGYWNPKYLLVLVGSIVVNFAASRVILRAGSDRAKTRWLIGSIAANLGLLVWFKYLFPLLGFFHGEGWLGRDFGRILLPLGISFFTFTQIAYLIDLSQGMAEGQDLLSYVLFVTFFPHLIAGPIIHHSEMMPQFTAQRHRGLRADDLAVGTTWFLMGLGKKVLVADTFGPVADAVYANPAAYGAEATWIGALCYAVQLYFDFSGYSDMALGLARMFSLTFPVNFNSPYKATGIIEFWQRFHMTLTRYLNLYLYTPIALSVTRRRMRSGLKVSRKAQRTLLGFLQMIGFPILATMFLAGIWHGAGVQFMIFGALHGMYLAMNHAWRTFVPEESWAQKLLPVPVSVVLTFLGVVVGDIFFRAQSTRSAVYLLGSMLGRHAGAGVHAFADLPTPSRLASVSSHAWLILAVIFAVIWALPNTQEILGQVEEDERMPAVGRGWLRWRPNAVWALGTICMTAAILTKLYLSRSFLYFQF